MDDRMRRTGVSSRSEPGGGYRVCAGRAQLVPALAVALLSGCMKADPPQFHLDSIALVEAGFVGGDSHEQRERGRANQQLIADVLAATFGTPDRPVALEGSGLNRQLVQRAAGPVRSTEPGDTQGLYRRHCAHCHGITGDGKGPTAAFLNPYPRDFRAGKFKFKSTEGNAKPTRADLHRILHRGIPGTAMPSFRLLPEDEREALVEYVMYLSMRGEMEQGLILAVFDLSEGDQLDLSREFLVDELLAIVASKWSQAESKVIHPEAVPNADRSEEAILASIEAGKQLFQLKTKGNCASCHGTTALGDGEASDQDDWNKRVKNFAQQFSDYDIEELGLLPVRNIHPRNLRQGVYRGGRRPLDIYRRIYSGINGVPMPSAKAALSPEEIWQLVDYVRSLPYEPLSEPPKLSPEVERERL